MEHHDDERQVVDHGVDDPSAVGKLKMGPERDNSDSEITDPPLVLISKATWSPE